MDTQGVPRTLGEYFGILRRRRIYVLTVFPALLLLSVYLAFSLTPYYRSSATILLEPASISDDLVKTLSSYADRQFELVQRKVLTQETLEPIVGELDPYPEFPEMSVQEKAQRIIDDTEIERVDPVTFEVLENSNAFSIHYLNADAERAAAIASRLSDLFLSYNRKSRNERATAAYEFLLARSRDVEQRIRAEDVKIAQFKSRHPDALPESQARNQGSAERAAQNLFDIEAQIRRAEEREGLLAVQLGRINPVLGSTTGNAQSELATLQGQLAEARVRYTPDHPDVKRLQRQIEALAAKSTSETVPTGIVPNNPDYLAVQSQLEAAQREISALRGNAARERARIGEFESGAAAAPGVERLFGELSRNRDALQQEFDNLQASLREADMSRNLESEDRGDRFSLIRAPVVSKSPFSPNRTGIILLGIVLGAALAMGLAALAESSDPSVRSIKDLHEITGIPVLASVPVMLNEEDRRKRLIWRLSYACVLFAATGVVALTMFAA